MVNPTIFPRKRFAQHFLKDNTYLQRLTEALSIQPTDCLVEIGPGQGALTAYLLAKIPQLIAIEIDRDLISMLKQRWDHTRLVLYPEDALTFDFSQLTDESKPLRIVGNLPYNIATPLLFHVLKTANRIQDLHVMVQKEVADRLIATPGSPYYSRLSVMIQYFCQVQRLFTVAPGAFYPPPRVNSAVVKLLPSQDLKARDLGQLTRIVRCAFSQRRKTLRNSLGRLITPAQWAQCQIDPQRRPQQLSTRDFVKLANFLMEYP